MKTDILLVQNVLIWVQAVCKGYQQTTKVATCNERVKKLLFFVIHCEYIGQGTHPPKTCTCPLKAGALKNIRELYAILLPRVILPKALVLQDESFRKNYSSFLTFTHNYDWMSGISVPCRPSDIKRFNY